MNLRTYEILAKWIGRTHGVTITFQPNVTPTARLNTNEILMPNNLRAEAGFAALSTLAHEAAHLRYSKEIPKDLVKDKIRHDLLNFIEDVRVDWKNFDEMPNMFGIYEKALEFDLAERKKMDMRKVPFHTKVLINCIYACEYLWDGRIMETDVEDFRRKHNVEDIIKRGMNDINEKRWHRVKEVIEELVDLFQLKPDDAANVSAVKKPGMCEKEKGTKGTKSGNSVLGEVAMRESTKQKFKELLNIREKQIIKEGSQLNTDNLTAFFTGDLEELFVQETMENKKKSKIMILLDASLSMNRLLVDNKPRYAVVANCTQSLIKILKEVQETEGLNVDYDVAQFDDFYTKLSKENWRKEYVIGCNTNIMEALTEGLKELNNNAELDGNKMMIIFTDGELHSSTVDAMKDTLVKTGDVRCMIVGVGAAVAGDFVTKIVGDNNIIATESSEEILLEAIMTMLGGD